MILLYIMCNLNWKSYLNDFINADSFGIDVGTNYLYIYE